MPLLSPLDLASRNAGEPEPLPVKRTLLIVDDEEGPRESLRIVFREDYHLLLAENGFQALELAAENHVDAAVLDIRMAGMSGTEVLGRLKRINPAIEVVMLTAFETVETARQALRLGACDYLTKPFDLGTIRAAVANAMERRSLSEEIHSNNQRLLELQDEIRNQKLREEIARTKGEIYASIIHDINGPLTVISGFIEIMNDTVVHSRRVEGASLEQLRLHLSQISRQVGKCIEISRRYLGFLRKRSTEKVAVSINQVFSDLQELLRFHPSAGQNQMVFQTLPEDDYAAINGTDLIQMLLNLSINALQSTPKPHAVAVAARRLREPLDLAQFQDGPKTRFINREGFANQLPLLAISVRDSGPGIAPEVMPRLFESFFSSKSPEQGTGLGLAIVSRFIQEAKGAVYVETAVCEGTTFTLYLPAAENGE